MRADAQQNRRAIVAAARTVFREDGLDASLTEVARRAGVGVATLYRRFPDRHCLVTAVFAEQMDEFVAVAGTAVADPDPSHGFLHVRRDGLRDAGGRPVAP